MHKAVICINDVVPDAIEFTTGAGLPGDVRFDFKTIGQLVTIGHRAGVASIFGVNVSGFLAWWMWRTIYLSKLPRLEKKVRVALDWTLDLFFSKDLCQFIDVRQEHKMSNEGLQHLQEPPHRQDAALKQPLAASATL